MVETLSKKTPSEILAQEENFLNWSEILKKFTIQLKNFSIQPNKSCIQAKKKIKLFF